MNNWVNRPHQRNSTKVGPVHCKKLAELKEDFTKIVIIYTSRMQFRAPFKIL